MHASPGSSPAAVTSSHPGSSRRPHLRDNLATLDLHLTESDLGASDAGIGLIDQ
ncbi:hypothetical protein [Actinopolymorpha pittospori]